MTDETPDEAFQRYLEEIEQAGLHKRQKSQLTPQERAIDVTIILGLVVALAFVVGLVIWLTSKA